MNKLSLPVLSLILGFLFLPGGKIYPKKTYEVEKYIRIPDSTNVQLLALKDGTKLTGRIIRIVADEVYFATSRDTARIFIPDILEIKEVPASWIKNGTYWFPNPNVTRLFAAPTGRPLSGGHGYVAGYYIIVPLIAYAFTSNISVSAAGYLLPTVPLAAAFLMPKFGVSLGDYAALAIGAGAVKTFWAEEFGYTTFFPYAVGTFGRPDASATLGAGYVFYKQGSEEFHKTLALLLGAEVRVARWVSVVTENYMIQRWSFIPIASLGVRFMGERAALDVGFINTIGHPAFKGYSPGFPFLGVTYNF